MGAGRSVFSTVKGNGAVASATSLPICLHASRSSLHCMAGGKGAPWTARKILPFIREYHVDSAEFVEQRFRSFNDFFIRKLRPAVRPLAAGKGVAIIPADGRYLFYPKIDAMETFAIKGKAFFLEELLQDKGLARRYDKGSLIIARLCPCDYHRFHFPCDALPGSAKLINGWLWSINPIALRRNGAILTQNKRVVTLLKTSCFGDLLYIEVGATNVGTIHQTYIPNRPYVKGDEKGFFSFGGSTLILLFEPQAIYLDADLVEATAAGYEMKCLLGQQLGTGK